MIFGCLNKHLQVIYVGLLATAVTIAIFEYLHFQSLQKCEAIAYGVHSDYAINKTVVHVLDTVPVITTTTTDTTTVTTTTTTETTTTTLTTETITTTTTTITTTTETTTTYMVQVNIEDNIHPNKKWLFNNNCMQYSAYIIKDGNDTWIEILVNTFHKYHPKTTLSEYIAVLRIVDTDEVIEVEPYRDIAAYNKELKKFYIKHESIGLHENRIAVAVIRKDDFSKRLTDTKSTNSQINVYPFDLINFQIANVITVAAIRKPAVALCINYVHRFMAALPFFLDMQKQFGIDKIQMYDATADQSTYNFIKDNSPKYDFVDVEEYNVDAFFICNFQSQKRFPNQQVFSIVPYHIRPAFDQPPKLNQHLTLDSALPTLSILKVKSTYIESCLAFAIDDMIYTNRRRHQDTSNNDCFTQLGAQYEFVALYDVDELIFPRTINPQLLFQRWMFDEFYCSNKKVCDLHPFSLNIYDYVKQMINLNYIGDLDKFSGIGLSHVSYLPYDFQEEILRQGREIVNKASNSTTVDFPIYIKIEKHLIKINNHRDLDYLGYILNFHSRVQCLNVHLDNVSTNYTRSFFRYMYHVTEAGQRFVKTVHYSKNVEMVFTHWAMSSKPGTKRAEPHYLHGEFLAHFRDTFTRNIYKHEKVTSIENVNIDIEYLSYLLRQHTSYC